MTERLPSAPRASPAASPADQAAGGARNHNADRARQANYPGITAKSGLHAFSWRRPGRYRIPSNFRRWRPRHAAARRYMQNSTAISELSARPGRADGRRSLTNRHYAVLLVRAEETAGPGPVPPPPPRDEKCRRILS